MRKRMFLAVVLSLCTAQFGAFAAVPARGNARGANSTNATTQQTGGSPVAARAGARQKVVSNTATAAKQTPAATVTGNTSARAGKKQAVVNNPNAGKVQGARAASTQKVIQTGSKIATAKENIAVPQECQDAFYGCMDSFCMLDNASGGRCQCSDRVTELDSVLEDILKLDEQTYIMATEGVERIQMGEGEEQIIARAKAAADKVTGKAEAAENAKKVRTLDLSAWNNNIFSESDEEDIFEDDSDDSGLVDTFADKKGDALYKASAKMCVTSVPEQCKQYGQMLQLVYAQRIKSDCVAYENSLKQQKNQSEQKLQTAQKALRDAALEEYKNQNKYATTGECAVAFAQCMQTKAECGTDYTGCVTLAAKENVANNKAGSKAKQTTIKGVISGADITLAASTMESLLAKKEICAYVTKQCVNSNKDDAVWNVFLRNAAPSLKSAEEIAEQNLRMQCIPTLADCFKTACKSNIDPKDEEGSYDMCLSNPKTYKSLCKVQLEPCLAATGGTYDNPETSSLWNGLIAALNSMKVDACTKEIKTCLTERCGDDFAGCVGLDTETIGNLCPVDKLTACVTDGRYADGKGGTNTKEIRAYVAEIAQGLAVQIDNSMLTVCQKALNESMIKVCGDTETCETLAKDESLGTRSLKYQVCKGDTCRESMDGLTKDELLSKEWKGKVIGELNWGYIEYNYINNTFTSVDDYISKSKDNDAYDAYNKEIAALQSAISNAIDAIESDPTVQYCMTGREVQGFDKNKINGKTKKTTKDGVESEESVARFPGLTDQSKKIIVAYALKTAHEKYQQKYNEVYEQLMKDQVEAAKKIDRDAAVEIAKQTCKAWGDGQDEYEDEDDKPKETNDNKNMGHSTIQRWNYKATISTTFNESTGVCTKETIAKECDNTTMAWDVNLRGCKHWAEPQTTVDTQTLM